MYHYVYKIENVKTGEYYIGKRSSKKMPDIDPYMGSGNWIKQLEKKFGRYLKSAKDFIYKHIIELCHTAHEAYEKEKKYIAEVIFCDPLNRNETLGCKRKRLKPNEIGVNDLVHKIIDSYETIEKQVKIFFDEFLPGFYSEDVEYSITRTIKNDKCFQIQLIVNNYFKPTFLILRKDFKHSDSHRELHKMGNVYFDRIQWSMLQGNIFVGE